MPDYTSTLGIERPPREQRNAEEWARAVWEQAPRPLPAFLLTGWRCLGLHPDPGPGRVLGWTIADSTPERIVLEVPSRLMTARNVVHLDAEHVRWTTEVDFKQTSARLLWSLAVPIHLRVIPWRLKRVAE